MVRDNSFGLAEAAALWHGNIEMVIHRHKSNHCNCEHFNLPRSISYAEAYSLTPIDSSWDGIFLGTIRDPEDAADGGDLFKNWQPLIAILALTSTISHKERKALWRGFENEDYTRIDVRCCRANVGGVTHAA